MQQQLKPMLANGVIYAFQFGWIGTWGEQHNDVQRKKIYRAFYLDAIPINRRVWRFTELGAATFSIIHNLNLCIAALCKTFISLNRFNKAGFICDLDYFGDEKIVVI